MDRGAKLVYKSYMTYFHTFLPVYFYGMPNGKIYCIYARFLDSNSTGSELEFVFAEHEDYSYEYEMGEIVLNGQIKVSLKGFKEMVDQPEQRIKMLKIYGDFKSYSEAQVFLNEQAKQIVSELQLEAF